MIKIDKVFIIHYTKLEERKINILNQLKNNNIINYEFIDKYDREIVSNEMINTYCYLDKTTLTIPECCVTIAHIETYKKIIENNYKFCLILEDDIILTDNFIDKLNKYLECIPNDIDLGFLVDGCGYHADNCGFYTGNITSSQIWYNIPISRTVSAYLITNTACAKILTTIIPFHMPIDNQLNIEIKTHNLQSYWCEPTICTEGSTFFYRSSLR
jgi:GR25 family glycosyltransferase involved in LPS biosynthesis